MMRAAPDTMPTAQPGHQLVAIYFVSVNSRSPSCAPSRPMPGLLHAAERRRRVGHDAAVEADHAGLQRLADPQPAAQVAGVDVGDQPELGVVGPADGVVLGGEPDHGRHRPEDLGAEDAGADGTWSMTVGW